MINGLTVYEISIIGSHSTSDMFKCLVLSEPQSKSQKYLMDNDNQMLTCQKLEPESVWSILTW